MPESIRTQFACLIGFKLVLLPCSLLPTALVSPMFTSVGFVLILPISVVGDVWKKGFIPPLWFYVGMILVGCGVALDLVAEQKKARNEKSTNTEEVL